MSEYNEKFWKAKRRLKKYGISESEFNSLAKLQNNQCAICKSTEPLHIDHCHKTNKIRGLLCGSCNRGLGMFKDNINVLNAAREYLEKML